MDALALLSDEDDDDEIFSDEEEEGGAGSAEANFAVYVLVANQKKPWIFSMFCSFLVKVKVDFGSLQRWRPSWS